MAGEYKDKPYYRREDGAWFIWWDTFFWTITAEVGGGYEFEWRGWVQEEIIGDYQPMASAEGWAHVAAGSH